MGHLDPPRRRADHGVPESPAGVQGRNLLDGVPAQASAPPFLQDDAKSPLRSKMPKLASLLDEAETDALAFLSFPKEHRPKRPSTNSIARLNNSIKRRTEVAGIFPGEDAIIRLGGALLAEQNDEWAVQRARSSTLETIAPLDDDSIVSLPAVAAWRPSQTRRRSGAVFCLWRHAPGRDLSRSQTLQPHPGKCTTIQGIVCLRSSFCCSTQKWKNFQPYR
ncbi:hypothetical protein J2852_004292 [Azospirillum soli]|nr:hypothetical protein [Azospirillum soli]